MTLVLVDDHGAPLGALPPFPLDLPFWPETHDVVAAARERFGVEVAVLRLLATERAVPPGGGVTYLAQASRLPDGLTTPVEVDLSAHPLRADYAKPGGPAASLRWAARVLDGQGLGPVTGSIQWKTWNLSAIWRLETPSGPVWLKQVPHFFGHEPAVLRWLAGNGHAALVPPVLAADGGRMLLGHVPGADLFGADPLVCAAIAVELHELQLTALRAVPALLDAGVPDQRLAPLAGAVRAVVVEHGGSDPRLDALVAGLDERLARVAACGLPDTLCHGDMHPGNVRGADPSNGSGSAEARRVFIDWGDSFVGHPGFDILRLTGGLDPADAGPIIDAWADRWRAAVPGCDPLAAIALLRPVEALRNAATYAHFLANIEPAEHPYHAADVPDWLGRAAVIG